MTPRTRHTRHYAARCQAPRQRRVPGAPAPPPPPPPPPPGCGTTNCPPEFANGPDVVLVEWVGAPPPWGGVYTMPFLFCIAGGGRWQGQNPAGSTMRAEWVTTGPDHWTITSMTIPAGCTYNADICDAGTCWDIMAPWPFVLTIP